MWGTKASKPHVAGAGAGAEAVALSLAGHGMEPRSTFCFVFPSLHGWAVLGAAG